MLMENVVVKDFPTMRVCPQCGINLAKECRICPQCGMDVTAVQSYPAAGSSLEQMKADNARLLAQMQASGQLNAQAGPVPQAASPVFPDPAVQPVSQAPQQAPQAPQQVPPAPQPAAPPVRQASFCPQCGTKLFPGARFCTTCGCRIS